MLASYLPKIQSLFTIILASSSPRRQSIFRENVGLSYEIMIPTFEENLDKATCCGPEDYVSQTSRMKCLDVISQVNDQILAKSPLIISADTIVVHNDRILEKPADRNDAIRTLKQLSNQQHFVLTAVTIAHKLDPNKGFDVFTFCEKTIVHFSELSEEAIMAYVATGEPMDKAGSYGAQGFGSSFVKKFDGCYFNVVGFPVNRFCDEFIRIMDRKI